MPSPADKEISRQKDTATCNRQEKASRGQASSRQPATVVDSQVQKFYTEKAINLTQQKLPAPNMPSLFPSLLLSFSPAP